MTRAKKIFRSVAALAAVWMVAGAGWPMDDVFGILGGIPCC